MFDTVVATPLSPGTATNSPTVSAMPRANVMSPLRRLRRGSEMSAGPSCDGSAELIVRPVCRARGHADSRQMDQVVAGQRSTDLLHQAAVGQAAEVDDEEARGLEQRHDLRLG